MRSRTPISNDTGKRGEAMSLETEVIDAPSDSNKILEEAGNKAFERINVKPEPSVKVDAEPAGDKPIVKDGNDKPVVADEIDEKTKADIKEGKIIPKHRFDEINLRMKGYESFGTPEELKGKLARLEEFLKKPDEPLKTPEQKIEELNDEDKEVQKYLFTKVAPELRDLPEILKMVRDMQAERKVEREELEKQVKAERETERMELQKHNTKALDLIKGMAKEAGLNVDDETNMAIISNTIADMVHMNKDMTQKYYGEKNLEILKEVFKDFQKRFFSGVQRKVASDILKDKKSQSSLPKPPVDGGSPVKDKLEDTSKLTLEQIGERAYAKITGG